MVQDIGGFIASFTNDGIETKVVYDFKARRHCTLTAFNENKTSLEAKDMVKTNYPQYNIVVSYEIRFGNDCGYIFKIENTTSIKLLVLFNGKLDLQGSYSR
jgi:hypothetical protein